MSPQLAWWFFADRLRDGRPIPPDGEWLAHEGPLALCESGLHASRHPFDALKYAPGPWLARVEVEGEIVEGADKLVCRRRRIVARRDLTDALRAFACDEALRVAHLWAMPEVVQQYLTTRHETIRAAAWDAARAAAMAAAMDAAWDAAGDAAMAAAWDAAGAAAWDAARAAAMAAAGDAAMAAAMDAAMAAAMDAAAQRFAAVVDAAFAEPL